MANDLVLQVEKSVPTLGERTTQKLRGAIISQHLKPNERLVERDLCDRTGVSRTCVREALRYLESEGLVVRQANRGFFVASVTVEEAREIYEVRAAIESGMGRKFAERANDKEIAELSAVVRAYEQAVIRGDSPAYVSALERFYGTLMTGARNDTARRVLDLLRARITYLRTLTFGRSDRDRELETARLMGEIVKAAVQRDGEEVARRCEAFVRRSAEFALKVLEDTLTLSAPATPPRPASARAASGSEGSPSRRAGARSTSRRRKQGRANRPG